jgi:four helix bundle protein
MFLQLAHTKLDIYAETQKLILECYKITKKFPSEERFILAQQIRRAAISVHLNLSEGSSRKSIPEKSRFYEIARSSTVEIDSALDIACKLNYVGLEQLQPLGDLIIKIFKMLSGMIR